jgi:DNA-binding response OmpR family regulator
MIEMLSDKPAILITDDDRDFRETLRDVFAPRGFQPLLAADGEEALEIVHRQPIHVLLLDMQMPRLDGLQTVRLVKQLKVILPCILLSARMDEKLAERARQADVFSSLAKPIRFREVLDTVHEALRVTYDWPPC